MCDHNKALYKSTFTLPYLTLQYARMRLRPGPAAPAHNAPPGREERRGGEGNERERGGSRGEEENKRDGREKEGCAALSIG